MWPKEGNKAIVLCGPSVEVIGFNGIGGGTAGYCSHSAPPHFGIPVFREAEEDGGEVDDPTV